MNILIVEDDEASRMLLGLQAEDSELDVQVVTASSGEEALRLMGEAARIELVLLDLRMPRMDGWAFRREQLADDSLAAIPVVLLSGADEAAYAGDRLTVAAVLAKPFDIHEMLAMVYRFAGVAA